MPWQAQDEHGGFSRAAPWLPVGSTNLAHAVDRQDADPQSLLNLTRELIAVRNANPALRQGDCTAVHTDEHMLVLRRTDNQRVIYCVFNLSDTPCPWPAEARAAGQVLAAVNAAVPGARLPPFAAIMIEGKI